MTRLLVAGAAAFLSAVVLGGAEAKADIFVRTDGSLASVCSKQAAAGRNAALNTCTRALTEEGLTARDLAGTYVNRGATQLRLGAYDAALADFERAAAVQPGMGEAAANRGVVAIAQGRFAESVSDLSRGLSLGVEQEEKAYYYRAVAREALRDYSGAYSDYRRAASLNPQWALPRADLARFTVRRQ